MIVSEINSNLDAGQTPVSGGRFRRKLTKEYAKKQGKSTANLFKEGALRFNIAFEPFRDGVDTGVFNDTQAKKAFGHQTGFKGHPHIKQGKFVRQIVPNKGQQYRPAIREKIKEIVNSIREEEDLEILLASAEKEV